MNSELRNRKNPNKNKKNNENFNKNEIILNEKVERDKSDEPVEILKKNEEFKINKNINENINENDDKYVEYDIYNDKRFILNFNIDLMTISLFVIAFLTRIYKLSTPKNIVFDELHYGKYVSLYMKNIFFFDQHPPLGKQLISGVCHFIGYDGNYTFARIGSEYSNNVPIFWLRFIPALSGSLIAPSVYKLLLQMRLNRWTSALGGLLIIMENAFLTQSRFILMESMMLLFSVLGLLFLLKSQDERSGRFCILISSILSAIFFTFTISIKYVGFYSCSLGFLIVVKYFWDLLGDKSKSNLYIFFQFLFKWTIFTIVPAFVYLSIFYIHLKVLYKAGPHDSVMTSAFQASLDGGLASITKGQPINVVHGSQITLRHTLGRACWLHSHAQFYPVKYPDKRGSSHQQQVTCYCFKDVNNWWIVKRPEKNDLIVGEEPDLIRDGDEVQLIHGITSRALNSHDVAAPMSPQCQEVSCYVDWNVSMSAQILWRVEIINKEQEDGIWHAITSQVRLIHIGTNQALKFSGRQLPDWGYNQHEVVADRVLVQPDTVWNVEEHRYTKTEDQKELERQLLNAEMIPTSKTELSFWKKFVELQNKMLWFSDPIQSHMYSSEPLDWPLMSKGIAYWVDKNSNAQIHLLGNIVIWYSATFCLIFYSTILIFYLLRRRRLIYDINEIEWIKYKKYGEIFLLGYLINFLPYFFVERTLFLHSYLPAYLFKIMLLCCLLDHINIIARKNFIINLLLKFLLLLWIFSVYYIFKKYLVLSYGMTKLKAQDVINLRWLDTWDFILHKDLP